MGVNILCMINILHRRVNSLQSVRAGVLVLPQDITFLWGRFTSQHLLTMAEMYIQNMIRSFLRSITTRLAGVSSSEIRSFSDIVRRQVTRVEKAFKPKPVHLTSPTISFFSQGFYFAIDQLKDGRNNYL